MADSPVISVVIPVRNGADTLAQQLDSLAAQRFDQPFEVLVCDNGSTDGTVAVAQSYAGRVPGLAVVDASGRAGTAYARNAGVRAARGAVVAFCDADDVVCPDWVASMVEGASRGGVVAGVHEEASLNDDVTRSWVPASDTDPLRCHLGFLPFASGSNLAIRRSLYESLGGCNEDYARSEDVDLCWRAILSGAELVVAPGAVVHYRFRRDLRGAVRQMVASGLGDAFLYRTFRSAGFVPRRRATVRAWAWIVVRAPRALLSEEWRGRWLRTVGYRVGRLRGSIRYRVFFP
ncbi:MAG: glycosyltransferase [Acidimicrobiales bacterium]